MSSEVNFGSVGNSLLEELPVELINTIYSNLKEEEDRAKFALLSKKILRCVIRELQTQIQLNVFIERGADFSQARPFIKAYSYRDEKLFPINKTHLFKELDWDFSAEIESPLTRTFSVKVKELPARIEAHMESRYDYGVEEMRFRPRKAVHVTNEKKVSIFILKTNQSHTTQRFPIKFSL